MIEKLKAYEETPSGYKHPENLIQDKINEIIDYLNEEHNVEKCVEKAIKDPFSRQRKWIGKLCKFWDGDDPKFYSVGILNSIKEDQQDPFDCLAGFYWTHCEPFFPDVNTIYTQGVNND